MNPHLIEKLKEPAYQGLNDWEAAEVLNRPDSTLQAIVEITPTFVGPGRLMETIGVEEGAALLDTLLQLAQVSSPIKWAMKLIENEGIDVSSKAFRQQLDLLVSFGKVSVENATKIKALAETVRYPSWAEYHRIEVTPRTVGLARGGK